MTKRVSSEFILTSVSLSRHGWLFRGTHFIGPMELKVNDAQKRPIVQALDNTINIFFNKSKHYFILCFFIKYFWITILLVLSPVL